MKKNLIGISVVVLAVILCGCRAGGELRFGDRESPPAGTNTVMSEEALPPSPTDQMQSGAATSSELGPEGALHDNTMNTASVAPMEAREESQFAATEVVLTFSPETFGDAISKIFTEISWAGKYADGRWDSWVVISKEKAGVYFKGPAEWEKKQIAGDTVYKTQDFYLIERNGQILAGTEDYITRFILNPESNLVAEFSSSDRETAIDFAKKLSGKVIEQVSAYTFVTEQAPAQMVTQPSAEKITTEQQSMQAVTQTTTTTEKQTTQDQQLTVQPTNTAPQK